MALCALLGNQQSHNVPLTNLQVVELQRAVAAQELATEMQAAQAAAVQAKTDEKVAEALKKVGPSNPPAQASVQLDQKKKDGDGGLLSSRSGDRGHSSRCARRRSKHAGRAQDLLTYQGAYEIVNGAASEFNETRGYSSEHDAWNMIGNQ